MVNRKVKLAQVVCAVYSLNKPTGASKTEILRFCKNRFRCSCNSKELDRILERALDEGLLTSFRKRYRVTKLRFDPLWSGGISGVRRKKGTRRGKIQREVKAVSNKRRNFNRKPKNFPKRQTKLATDSSVKPLSLYELWKKEVQREIKIMTKNMRNFSRAAKSICKKRKSGRSKLKSNISKSKRDSFKLMARRNHGGNNRGKSKNWRETKHKVKKNKILISKINHKTEQRSEGNVRKGNRKKRGHHNRSRKSRASTRNSEFGQHSEFHRTLLRQTKHAVVHARSWDKLNFTRQRRMRENEELVKKSQLLQKILTQAHAVSWDDLNAKLKHLKEVNCSPQQT